MLQIPTVVKWLIFNLLLWLIAIPWAFLPFEQYSAWGIPLWIIYSLIAFVLYALVVAFVIVKFWDKLAAADEAPTDD